MFNTKAQKGVTPRRQAPDNNPVALPKVNGALTAQLAKMAARDVSTDGAYTDGPSTTCPDALCSVGSAYDHPSNAYQATGSSFLYPDI
jgi:hypothetical protein